MSHKWCYSGLVCLFAVALASVPAVGATSGSVSLFGGVTYDFQALELPSITYQDGGDGGVLTADFHGTGLGYYEGATIADDRLYMTDETDGGDEEIVFLTGIDPTTYTITSNSTLDFIANNHGGGTDPHAIEWVSDVTISSSTLDDINIWVVRASSFRMSGLDADLYTGPGTLVQLPGLGVDENYLAQSTKVVHLGEVVGLNKPTAACKNPDNTRMYIGGVINFNSAVHYGIKVLDIGAQALVSEYPVLLPQLGTPFQSNVAGEPIVFAFHALAVDRHNDKYLAIVLKGAPGSEQRWIYQFSSFPDPSATETTTHNDSGFGGGLRLDNIMTFGSRPDRMGMCTGRGIDVGQGFTYPVIYILNQTTLYTLIPRQLPPISAVSGSTWSEMR